MLRSFDDDDIDNVDNDDDDDWHEDAVDNHIDDMGMMVTKLMTSIMWFAMMIMIDADFDKCNFYVELVQEAAQQITGHSPRSHINFTFHDCMHALFRSAWTSWNTFVRPPGQKIKSHLKPYKSSQAHARPFI